MDISFVILTWNSKEYISRCLSSYIDLLEDEKLSGEIWIVDNGSSDGTPAYIQKEIIPTIPQRHCINIIQLDKNMGTTMSRNMALRQVNGRYIVVCDSDTEYFEGSITDALHMLESQKEIGLIAPLLIWPDGEPQPSVRKFPTILSKGLKLIEIMTNIKPRITDMYHGFPWEDVRPVQTAASAFWVFRKEVLSTVGFFDEKIFYSPEDVDYCLRAWKQGLKVIFFPSLKIYHHAQRIGRKKPFSRHGLSHMVSYLYFFVKHGYLLNPGEFLKEV